MSIAILLVALLLAFLAFRFVVGVMKYGVILVVLAVAAWFLLGGHS